LFDKPYEPSVAEPPPSEPAATVPAPARAGLSPTIRPRRKVAALLGGKA
jgi:hypothetical protein